MATTLVRNGEGEDILGLVAFGSLVTTIFQIASKKPLQQPEALKAYAAELRRHYETMQVREKLVYNENLELKRANEGLISVNNRLLMELVEARNEIIRLKGASVVVPRQRMGPHGKQNGGSQ